MNHDDYEMSPDDNDHWTDVQRLHHELDALMQRHGFIAVLEALVLIGRQQRYPERFDRLGAR